LTAAASYVDHYDAKVNICYVAIVRNDTFDRNQKITYSTDVFDAFEGTSYATTHSYPTTSGRH